MRIDKLKVKGQRLKIKDSACILILTFNFLLLTFVHCAQQLQEIEVKSGDTLWGVANYYLKEPSKWPEILKFNNISADPNNVLPGMKLKIPVLMLKEQLRSSVIVSAIRTVKMRRQAEMNWTDAKENTKLYNKDGVRTLENSYAGIKSPSGNMMTIGPSSLVIIQPEEKSEETRLLSGEIRTSNVPIRTPTAYVVPKITAQTPLADYKARVREDQSTVVAVYKGAVDVTAKNKTVTIPEGFSTEVKINLPPMDPKKLPSNMDFPSDENTASLAKELNLGEINVGGQPSKTSSSASWFDIASYHIQVAKDKSFDDVIYDENKPIYEKFDMKKVNIPEGRYFWRVAYLDSSGAEGIVTSAKEVFVDRTPPSIKISEPAAGMKFSAGSVRVKGATDLHSKVYVNGFAVYVGDDGSFVSDVSIAEGENVINVRAEDFSGNISTASVRVYQPKKEIKQKSKGFFSTPWGIVVSIITISALTWITVVTVGG